MNEPLRFGAFLIFSAALGLVLAGLFNGITDAHDEIRELKAEVVELREELHGGFDCTHEGQRGECRTGGGK